MIKDKHNIDLREVIMNYWFYINHYRTRTNNYTCLLNIATNKPTFYH